MPLAWTIDTRDSKWSFSAFNDRTRCPTEYGFGESMFSVNDDRERPHERVRYGI
jgi:hypothetical protein